MATGNIEPPAPVTAKDNRAGSKTAFSFGELGAVAGGLFQCVEIGIIVGIAVRQVLEFSVYPEVLLGALSYVVLEKSDIFFGVRDHVFAGHIFERWIQGVCISTVSVAHREEGYGYRIAEARKRRRSSRVH